MDCSPMLTASAPNVSAVVLNLKSVLLQPSSIMSLMFVQMALSATFQSLVNVTGRLLWSIAHSRLQRRWPLNWDTVSAHKNPSPLHELMESGV